MGKGGFKSQVILLAALFLGVCLAVFFLFSGSSKKPAFQNGPVNAEQADRLVRSSYPAAEAVPLDAAMILCTGSVKTAIELINNPNTLLREFLSGTGKVNLVPFIDSLAKPAYSGIGGSCLISLHYNRDMEPLMVLENCGNDSKRDKVADLARRCQLDVSAAPDSAGKMLLISPSQGLVASSLRHIAVGSSILEDSKFTSAALETECRDAIYIFGKYFPKFVGIFMGKDYQKTGTFLSTYADVLALTINRHDDQGNCNLKLGTACLGNPAYLAGAYDYSKPEAPRVLTDQTSFAVSLTTGGIANYIEKHKRYLDANSKLSQYTDSAEKWARGLDIKEICKAELCIDGVFSQILAIRTGSEMKSEVLLLDTGVESLKEYRTAIIPYAYPGYAATQFGEFFKIADEGFFYYKDGWMVIGPNKTLTELLTGEAGKLEEHLDQIGIRSSQAPFVYFDYSAYAEALKDIFDTKYAPSVTRTLKGTAGRYLAISGKELVIKRVKPSKSESKLDPSAVIIPQGPFEVTDYSTGKKNKLSQDKNNNNLILTNEKGEKVWTKPFPGKIAGAAGELDYYVNGRIQFLVASGSKIYLIDRLGRIVKGFPAELGKEVLLGPDVYDFSGAHGYSAIVLHDDNTIGMYDLHGRVRQGWKGFNKCEEQIITLPELMTSKDGKRQWKVTTKTKIYTYPLYGGEPVKKEKR